MLTETRTALAPQIHSIQTENNVAAAKVEMHLRHLTMLALARAPPQQNAGSPTKPLLAIRLILDPESRQDWRKCPRFSSGRVIWHHIWYVLQTSCAFTRTFSLALLSEQCCDHLEHREGRNVGLLPLQNLRSAVTLRIQDNGTFAPAIKKHICPGMSSIQHQAAIRESASFRLPGGNRPFFEQTNRCPKRVIRLNSRWGIQPRRLVWADSLSPSATCLCDVISSVL
jgi:hypothetical protein